MNKKKYNSIYKEVILLGKEKYLIYFKRKEKELKASVSPTKSIP